MKIKFPKIKSTLMQRLSSRNLVREHCVFALVWEGLNTELGRERSWSMMQS